MKKKLVQVAPISTTKMAKKDYFVFTDSRVPEIYIENFGDRTMITRDGRLISSQSGWRINGDPLWEINEKNLISLAKSTFDAIIKEREIEAEEVKKKDILSERNMLTKALRWCRICKC